MRAWLAGSELELLAPLRWLPPGETPSGPWPVVDRRALVAGLERANVSYGHPGAAALGRRLADPATRVVVAGQQPGLLGGPLYTLLKLIAAARWAERLGAAGQPAVAVFWVATEDHDFGEVARAAVWANDGLHRLSLGEDPLPLTPVGMRTLGPGVDEVLAELAALFPYQPYSGWVERLRQCYRPQHRFGEAFCRLAVELLGDRCPLLLDAMLPELKAAEAPWLRRLVEEREAVAAALAAADRRLEGRGHPLQVAPQPGAAPLFLLAGGERRRVLWEGGGRFSLRGGAEGARPLAELLAAAADNPAALSPNVLSRPVVQDAVLGTSLSILGPGELSYMAQAAALYDPLQVAPPWVTLRPQALVVERRHLAVLDELGLPPQVLFASADAVDRRLAHGEGAALVAEPRDRVEEALATLRSAALELDPNLERPWEKTRDHVRTALERFEERVTRAAAHRDEVRHRRLDTLREYCAPGGVPHERVLASAHFRGRYGEGMIERLWEALDLTPGTLQLIAPPED
ncbi:MAG TPA: bacillithiol biosynthesis cysteine-adding enzyme BshC [Thermoanaerobaculia bacterium]|nr:bacillithiol biosynthesis cysteine-adding enzyme BshC [Thermoanaerobaculia bacterium]